MRAPHRPKSRSNRTLTEFACANLWEFLHAQLPLEVFTKSGNTSLRVTSNDKQDQSTLVVSLYDQPILNISRNSNSITRIVIEFTSYFDRFGQPTATTAERLNGLLDCLGESGIVPRGIRVFRDKAWNTTYIGRGDERIAVGKNLSQAVAITVNRGKFVLTTTSPST